MGLPGGLAVRILRFSCGAQVFALVGELRARKLHGQRGEMQKKLDIWVIVK